MAIKSINGTSVYVLEPRRGSGKTTSGKNWATLYSDLRWKVWEEIKENELRKSKFDQLTFKAQTDMYEQESKDLRRSINNLQELKAKVLAGGGTATQVARNNRFNASQEQKAAATNARERAKAAKSGQKTTTTKREIRPGRGGREDREMKRTETTRKVTPYKAPQISPAFAGSAGAEAGTGTAAAMDELDKQILELETQLQGISMPTPQSRDILSDTRRSFEKHVGVIGQGGGAFGLAPRPQRKLPIADEELAQRRIDDFVGKIKPMLDKQDAFIAEETKKMDDLNRKRAEIGILFEDRGQPPSDKALGYLEAIDAELAASREAVAKAQNQRQSLSKGITPVAHGDFLRRDTGGFTPPRETSVIPSAGPRATVIPGEASFEGADAYADDAAEAEARAVVEAAASLGSKPAGGIPPASAVTSLPPADIGREGPSAAIAAPVTRFSDKPPMAISEADALSNPAIFNNPDFAPDATLLSAARRHFKGSTVQVDGGKSKKVRFPIRHFGGEVPLVQAYLKAKEQEAMPRADDGNPSTAQRKEKYKMKIATEGAKLAAKPKKFKRISKADTDAQPENIKIVDKLYETNRSSGDAFKRTYDEISRVYADSPDIREASHTYLVAKDILESNIPEPLA